MLFLAKAAGILVLIWFYMTAREHQQPGVKWAIIGLIGYWLTWWLSEQMIVAILPTAITRTMVMGFLVLQIPAICGMLSAYFIRKKLLTDIEKNSDQS
ncbi:MAG: hypothetical protein RL637_1371 [Pseudomonadota bacterium]|jgi:hypothetical protein